MRRPRRAGRFLTDLSDAFGRGKGLKYRRHLGRLEAYVRPRYGSPKLVLDVYVSMAGNPASLVSLDRTQVPRLMKALARFMEETAP